MKRCAIAIVAAAAMIAAPTAAISPVMLLHDDPMQPYASTVDPRVSIRNLGYECDNRGLRANSTYLSTSGQTVNNLCVLNPTGYYLQATNNNNNKLMASVQFNNVLRRDPATGKDVVVVGAVAFGSDDGKTTCCSAAGVTIAPGPDPAINATCKLCQYVPRNRMAQSADVVFNVDFDTSVHVDFFDSAFPNAKRCDHESVAPRRSYQAWDSCTRPAKLFAMTAPSTTSTCNVTITSPDHAPRAPRKRAPALASATSLPSSRQLAPPRQDGEGASPQGCDEDSGYLTRWPEALPFDVVPGPLMVGLFAWLPFRQVAASKEQLEQHCNAVTLISRPHPATTLRALELIKRVSSFAVTGVGGRAHTVNLIGTTLVAESLAALSRLPALTDLSVALPSLPRAEQPLDTAGHATFFAAAAKLTRLWRLSVETQAIDADAIVRNCPHLTALLLPMTGGLDLAPIIQLPALATLQFPAKNNNGHASALEALRGSTTLTCLDLTGCSVLDAALDVLPTITSLRTLKIVRSRSETTTAAVPHITACRALEALDISASVGVVPGLKSLSVSTLRSLRAVALLLVVPEIAVGCPALEELNVSSSSCSAQTIEALRACPSLRVLSVSQAEVDDDGLICVPESPAAPEARRELQRCDRCGRRRYRCHPCLTDLSLAHNRLVTEESVNDLERCRGLRVLNVARCGVHPGLKARGIVDPNVMLLGLSD